MMQSTYGTDNEKGTGLGLPLCKELAEKIGGQLNVISISGKGSTFSLTLPQAKIKFKGFVTIKFTANSKFILIITIIYL